VDKTVLLTTRVANKRFEIALDFEVKPGLAESRDLESDLAELICVAGEAAKEHGTTFVLAIDELHYVPEEELAALISALHRANQLQLPSRWWGQVCRNSSARWARPYPMPSARSPLCLWGRTGRMTLPKCWV